MHNERRGREIKIPPLKGKSSVRTLRDQSFQVNGPKLFNSIPKKVCNLTKVSVGEFKEQLDKFLEKIPDQPNVDGLTPTACNLYNAAPSNSIVDQARTILPHRRPGASKIKSPLFCVSVCQSTKFQMVWPIQLFKSGRQN